MLSLHHKCEESDDWHYKNGFGTDGRMEKKVNISGVRTGGGVKLK